MRNKSYQLPRKMNLIVDSDCTSFLLTWTHQAGSHSIQSVWLVLWIPDWNIGKTIAYLSRRLESE